MVARCGFKDFGSLIAPYFTKTFSMSPLTPIFFQKGPVCVSSFATTRNRNWTTTFPNPSITTLFGKTTGPQARWQHSEKEKTEKEKQQDRRDWFIDKLLKILSALGVAETTIWVFILTYPYSFTPAEDWPDWLQRMFKTLDERKKNNLRDEYEFNLVEFEKTISNLKGLESVLRALSFTDIEKRLQEILANHKKELEEKKKELEADYTQKLEAEKEKAENYLSGKMKNSQLEIDKLTDALENAQEKIQEHKTNGSIRIAELEEIIQFYKECGTEDVICMRDFHRLQQEKIVIFPYGYTFSKSFFPLLSKSLAKTSNGSLNSLNVKGTYILRDGGLSYLMEGLKTNNSIKTLDLTNTSLKSENLGEIIEMLGKNKTLETLTLATSSLYDKDALRLLLALDGNPSSAVKLIDLSNSHAKGTDEQLKNHPKFGLLRF